VNLREDTVVARRNAVQYGQYVTLETLYAAVDKRNFIANARAVERIARFFVVNAGENDVGTRDLRLIEQRRDRFDFDFAVILFEVLLRGFGLFPADVGFKMENLAV